MLIPKTLAEANEAPGERRRVPLGASARGIQPVDLDGDAQRGAIPIGADLYGRKAGYGSAYGAYDLLQNIYNLNGKAIPGKYQSGVDQDDKYFTPKGMARSGVR